MNNLAKKADSLPLYNECLWIVANKQYKTVDGVRIDLTSASLFLAVRNSLNEKNKEYIDSLSVEKAIELAYKVAHKFS